MVLLLALQFAKVHVSFSCFRETNVSSKMYGSSAGNRAAIATVEAMETVFCLELTAISLLLIFIVKHGGCRYTPAALLICLMSKTSWITVEHRSTKLNLPSLSCCNLLSGVYEAAADVWEMGRYFSSLVRGPNF